MISRGDRVLIGISGGADSTTLLYLLDHFREKLGIELYAAHLDHKIRGADAKKDEG
ncbi:ATP-binding protein [Candidatus Margulisiibacteriota bacterium]